MMECDATAGKLKPREFKSVLECELICFVFHSGGRTPNSRNLNKGKVEKRDNALTRRIHKGIASPHAVLFSLYALFLMLF